MAGWLKEALNPVRRCRFDEISLDLYLTPISGVEILRAAIEADEDVAIVMMTSNPSVASCIEALREGAGKEMIVPYIPRAQPSGDA